SPVKSVANYPTAMAGALAAADRVFEVLDLEAEEGDRPGEVPARFERCIEYRGVTFSYNGEAPVLHGVDLEVRRGQVAAVVGPSGAGKTTLVDLLPRFYEPTGGTIMVDGVPITRFTRSSLRSLMGIVSQEAIDRLMAHRTTFVIAHRLATVQHADVIVVLADGRVVEQGTHATLYAAGGLYRRLHDMQFRP